MKVAMLAESYLPNVNGVSIFVDMLARHFNAPVLVSGSDNILENKGIRVYRLKGSVFKKYKGFYVLHPQSLGKLLTILEFERPDIVHAHAPTLHAIGAILYARKFRKKAIITYHTRHENLYEYLKLNFLDKTFIKPSLVAIHNQFDVTTAPTKYIARYLKSMGIKRVKHVPLPVRFDGKKPKKLSKKRFTFLYVGRLGYEKRLELLMKAANFVDADIWVAGKGPAYRTLKKMAPSNVKFLGFVPDEKLPSLYYSCDAFVSPSDTETFGLTYVEAMLYYSPVISSNAMAGGEIVKHNYNGLNFKAGDVKDLIDKMKLIMDDSKLRRKLSRNARIYAEGFLPKNVLPLYENLYRTVRRRHKPLLSSIARLAKI